MSADNRTMLQEKPAWRCAGCGAPPRQGLMSGCNCPTNILWRKVEAETEYETKREVGMQPTMWAEMSPDVYGGKNCDQIVPRWHTYGDGDKEAAYEHKPLILDARRFPPGTKITIEEPHCPTCGEPRWPKFPQPKRGPLFNPKCDCGFDWDEWTRETYA